MIHRTAFGLAMLLVTLSVVSLHGAMGTMNKDLFLLAAQYFFWAIVSFGIGGAAAWLKFELAMSGLKRWHEADSNSGHQGVPNLQDRKARPGVCIRPEHT